MTGLIGFPSGYRAMEACDTLLMLGTDFPYRQFYPGRARIENPKPGPALHRLMAVQRSTLAASDTT